MYLHCLYWYRLDTTQRFDTAFQNFSLLQRKSRIQGPHTPFQHMPVLNALSSPFTSLQSSFFSWLILCASLSHPPFFCLFFWSSIHESIPFLHLSFLSSSQNLLSILAVSLKLHFPALSFFTPSSRSCFLYIILLQQHVPLLLISFGYFPL